MPRLSLIVNTKVVVLQMPQLNSYEIGPSMPACWFDVRTSSPVRILCGYVFTLNSRLCRSC